jgi:hypothetical protein
MALAVSRFSVRIARAVPVLPGTRRLQTEFSRSGTGPVRDPGLEGALRTIKTKEPNMTDLDPALITGSSHRLMPASIAQTPQPPDPPFTPEPPPPTPQEPPDTVPDPTREPPSPPSQPIGDPPPGPNETPHMSRTLH